MSLSTFLTSSSTPQRVNRETAYFHKVVWCPVWSLRCPRADHDSLPAGTHLRGDAPCSGGPRARDPTRCCSLTVATSSVVGPPTLPADISDAWARRRDLTREGQHAVAATMRRVATRSDHDPFRAEIPTTGDMRVTVGRPPCVRAASCRSERRASDTFTAGFDVLKASANEVKAARTTDDATRRMAHSAFRSRHTIQGLSGLGRMPASGLRATPL
jgi:hypothetical protein